MTRPVAALALAALGLAGCRTVVWYGSSPGRAHRVEVVERLGRQRVIVDGVGGPEYRAVGVGGLVVLDGGATAYPARRDGSWRVVWNGREGEPWDGVGEITLSDGGGHLAYAALRGGAWRVVVDGRAGPSFDAIFAGSMRLSTSGLVLYAAERRGRSHAVLGERVGPPCDGVAAVALSVDGAHAGWLERAGAAHRAVVDGVPGPLWDEARDLALSGDGMAAYAARRGGAWWVAAGAELRGPHLAVSRLHVSPDGLLVYVASDERGERVVTGGDEGPLLEAVSEVAAGDRGRAGYIGRRGGLDRVVVDGVERGAWLQAAGLTLGPEGRWAAVAADRAGSRVVHDRGEERIPAAVPDTLAFARDGRWGVVAGERGSLFIAVEGGARLPLDSEEVAAAALRAPGDPDAVSRLLRAWVAAEVGRAVGPK